MKKLVLLTCAVFVIAGVASAAEAPAPAATEKTATEAAAPAPATDVVANEHVVEAEVVSADADAKTVTVKTPQGEATMKVTGVAAEQLKTLKAGEKVTLMCHDNAKGEHEAITEIVVAPAAAPAK